MRYFALLTNKTYMKKKNLLAGVTGKVAFAAAITLLASSTMLTSCKKNSEAGPEVVNNESASLKGKATVQSYQSGTNNGYFWSLWKSDGATGTCNYANGSGGNYSVSWNGFNGNFTCGKGWSTGSRTRTVNYNCGAFTMNGGGGSFAYYGWTRSPLIEYYVNEKWGGTRPASSERRGSVSSNGGTYDIYTAMRYNAPSIDGTQTFRQVFSTRASQAPTAQNRSITFANHVNAWSSVGLGLGSDISPAAILLTESYGTNTNGYVNASVW